MDVFNVANDFILLINDLIIRLWQYGAYNFFTVVGVGLVIAGVVWWLSSLLALNFNRQFSFHTQHHMYCSIAALMTLFFVILFFALRYTEDVAGQKVESWGATVKSDVAWKDGTFLRAYEAVYDLHDSSGNRLEDFSNYPHPTSASSTRIPTTTEQSRKTAAHIYSKAMVDHFRSNHGFLSLILWASSSNAEQAIYSDMSRVFEGESTYSADTAIKLAENRIREHLEKQLPRVVLLSRIILVATFLLVQLLTLFLLIRAALKDIKENDIKHLKLFDRT